MKFSDVFKKYGRPVVSKDKDSKIQTYQNFRKKGYSKEEATNPNICVRGGQLVGNNLKPTIMGKLSKKDIWVLDTNIKISSMCCDKLKKLPFKNYSKQSGRDCPITGVRTQESLLRRLQNKTCFKKVGNRFQLTPIYDWKNDDIELYIKEYNVNISRCYTEMGMKRTGCHLCPYNRNLFNDLDIIAEHHPKLHKFIWEIMGDIYTEKRKNNEKK